MKTGEDILLDGIDELIENGHVGLAFEMLRLKRREIDKERWDEYVERARDAAGYCQEDCEYGSDGSCTRTIDEMLNHCQLRELMGVPQIGGDE